MLDRMSSHDRERAALFAAHRSEAEAQLRRKMEALGLYERDGWKVTEVMRESSGGTELVLRPLHLRRDAPPGLECMVWICGDSGAVRTRPA